MRWKILSVLLTSTVLAVSFTSKIYAQENNKGLSITPLSFDYSLDLGQVKTGKVFLTNLTSQPLDITTEARNFTANGEEGDVVLTTENTPFSLASWVSVEPRRVTIPPSAKLPFTFTIKVPSNAEPGGHFGSVVFATVPKKDLNQTGALLSQEIGALLFTRTPGNIKENAKIASFKTEKSFYEFGPVNFVARVANEGNVHLRPSGEIVIKDMFGRTTKLPLVEQNILPNAIRKITTNWKEKVLLGKYTATVTMKYGTKNESLIATTEFTAFPVRWGLVALGVLLAIVFLNVIITMLIVKRNRRR